MHPANHHPLLTGHHGGKDFSPAGHRLTKRQRSIEGRIASMDRRGKDHQLGIADHAGAMGRFKLESLSTKALDFLGVHLVRTADTMTERQKKRRNAAHSGTGNSDEVNAT